jgi:UDP-N-acetylmuramate--alanine ligase
VKPDLALEVPPADALGRVHFIGIGGVGMAGLARIMLARGVRVTGSDAAPSATLDTLRALGAAVHVGHDAAHLGNADTVVVTSAARETNPELVEAHRRGLLVLHRSQALAALLRGRRAVAVAGTAGKTTTTSMLTVALQHCGADPSFAIGGELTDTGQTAAEGGGDVFVAEADESDGSFLLYSPTVAVVTNVEPDHLDHYGTAEAVTAVFDAFADRILPDGLLVACADDPGSAALADRVRARRNDVEVQTYGVSTAADVRIVDLDVCGPGVRFGLAPAGAEDGDAVRLALRVPGVHNALNAAAAWTAGAWLGLPAPCLADGLARFGGARRRFETKGTVAGVRVVDDYAHHPTKVAAVLRAVRGVSGAGRVLAIFQPHLYSRTRIFAGEFGAALGLADEVVVLDVYGAREDPEPGVTGDLVARAVPLPPDRVVFEPDRAKAVERTADRAAPGDVVLTLGAGDVTALGPDLLARLAERQPVGAERGEENAGRAPREPVGESRG